MSMFHELMMRKKEETLYPVIKGSLTDTDGIISGFINTGANYLQIDNMNKLSSANSWEITIKIVNSSGSYFIGTNLERIITISTGTSKVYISSNGSSWDIANGVGLNTSIPNDSYVRLRFTGTQYILDYSSDLTNWTNCATITSSTKISNAITSLIIGKWWTGNLNFTGSIDLNNSYIKLGSTKYNLQAVVGYTVVGSPTITDGVVSGFSSANYLMISSPFVDNISNNIEMKVSFVLNNFNTPVVGSTSKWNNNFFCISVNNSRKLSIRIKYNVAISFGTSVNLNTKINVVFRRKNGRYIANLYIDNILTETQTLESNDLIFNGDSFYFAIGYDKPNWASGFKGSIDLNETYIKINNKLWFNGQQA